MHACVFDVRGRRSIWLFSLFLFVGAGLPVSGQQQGPAPPPQPEDTCDAPLTSFRWYVRHALSKVDQDRMELLQREFIDQGVPVLPAARPLVVGDFVLMRTPWHLFGVEFKTGRRIWHYPWHLDPDDVFRPKSGDFTARSVDPRLQIMKQRTWHDAVYGQFASDGRHVFFIDRLGFAKRNPPTGVRIFPSGQKPASPGWPNFHNRLCAASLAAQGKVMWMVDDDDPAVEPSLVSAFFLGCPAVMEDRLYVLAELVGKIQLTVLDTNTGRLQWSRPLIEVGDRSIDRDPLRRLAGATPTCADGVVVCPTGICQIAGVNPQTRAVRWRYSYRRSAPAGLFALGAETSIRLGKRWADATLMIADGHVLATPVESNELHCLDLLTGKLKWKIPRDDFLLLACVHDGNLLLVGKNQFRGFRLDDGQPAWDARPLPADGMPSGRGYLSGTTYFLPTTAEQLVSIDVRTGGVGKPIKTRGVLGNLVCCQDAVISQGANLLTSFYQADSLRRQIEARLESNPNDGWALTRRAERLLSEGRRREALELLRKADRQEWCESRPLLIDTLLGLLREDFWAHRELVAEVEALIRATKQEPAFLRLVAAGFEEAGDTVQAFHAYLRLAGPFGKDSATPGVVPEGGFLQIDKHHRVRRDRWVQSRLATLFDQAAPDERKEMDEGVEQKLQAARDADLSSLYRQFIRQFDEHPLADEARLKLAGELIDRNELLGAEILLSRVVQSNNRQLAGRAVAELARLLTVAEHDDEAASQYRRLADEWPDMAIRDGLTGKELLAGVDPESPVGRALAVPSSWSLGPVEVTVNDKEPGGLGVHSRLYRLNVLSADPPPLSGVRATLDPARAQISVRDGWGRNEVQISLKRRKGTSFYSSNYGLSRARLLGHLLIYSASFELRGLNALRQPGRNDERELWLASFKSAVVEQGFDRARHYVRPVLRSNPWCSPTYVARDPFGMPVGLLGPLSDRGLIFMRQNTLVCVDPLTSEEIWSRTDGVAGSEFFGDQDTLVMIPPNATEARLYATSDGRRLGRVAVPPDFRRWTTHGRRILTWDPLPDDGEGNMNLRLYDPVTQRDVWACEFASGSKGWIVEGEEVAVMERSGRLVVIAMADGAKKVDVQLEKEEVLSGIYVLASPREYVVVTNSPGWSPEPNMHISPAPSGYYTPMVYGRAYSIDRQTGNLIWPAPVDVKQFGLPLKQPTQLPVLVFLRQIRRTDRGRSLGFTTSIHCVDKRTGEVVYQNDKIPGQTRAFQMRGNPEDAEVAVMIPGKTIRMKFSSEQGDPEAP